MSDDDLINPVTGDPYTPQFAGMVQGFGSGLVQQFTTPGAAAQPNPYPTGSEEAAWYDQNRQDAMNQWAPSMALSMIGAGAQFAKPGTLGIAGGKPTIAYAEHYPQDRIVHVDTAKADAAWSKDKGVYVGPGGEGGIGNRYNNAKQFLQDAETFNVPVVGVQPNGQFSFVDGRHRFAVMRDAGKETVPVQMDPDSVANAAKHGYIAEDAAARKTYGVSMDRLPEMSDLNFPAVPTVEHMQKFGRVESVPLDKAVTSQHKMQWDRFNSGDHPPPLIEGYGDKPVAVRKENGEYVVQDGNHRTVLEINNGAKNMDMHVIDAKDYDPLNAGRKPKPSAPEDDEALLRELFGVDGQ